jgi:hypothetical protein
MRWHNGETHTGVCLESHVKLAFHGHFVEESDVKESCRVRSSVEESWTIGLAMAEPSLWEAQLL